MDQGASGLLDEAARLGVLPRLEAQPCSTTADLARCGRVPHVGGLGGAPGRGLCSRLGRAAAGPASPGAAGHPLWWGSADRSFCKPPTAAVVPRCLPAACPAWHEPPAASPDLCSCLGLAEPVVGGLLDRMASQGLVESVPSSSGAPAFRLAPSAEGQQQQQATAPQQQAAQQAAAAQQNQQARRGSGSRRGSGVQPKVGRQLGPHPGQVSAGGSEG